MGVTMDLSTANLRWALLRIFLQKDTVITTWKNYKSYLTITDELQNNRWIEKMIGEGFVTLDSGLTIWPGTNFVYKYFFIPFMPKCNRSQHQKKKNKHHLTKHCPLAIAIPGQLPIEFKLRYTID